MNPSLRTLQVARPGYTVCVHQVRGHGTEDVVLLHGAGVASELTWSPMLPSLSQFRHLICIDLRGMGSSHALDFVDRPLSLPDVVDDVLASVDALSVEHFHLIGYSFGGLIALMVHQRATGRCQRMALLEPALLERESLDDLRRLRAQYAESVSALLDDQHVECGITRFLDLIAPNRSRHPRVERMTLQRLAARPRGLAYALMAVNEAAWHIERLSLIEAASDTLALVGGKSPDAAHAFHRVLERQFSHWTYRPIPGVDHAMPYQKPRQIGHQIASFLLD